MRMLARMTLALAAVTLLAVAPAAAQIQAGAIAVKAMDDQGAIMPGVTVTISSSVLPREIVGTTDAGGVFQVPGLTPGTYTLKFVLQGFQTYVRQDVVVRQGQTAGIDVPMKLGSVSESVP
jgi:Carboxypeptidase regulatory-like domain